MEASCCGSSNSMCWQLFFCPRNHCVLEQLFLMLTPLLCWDTHEGYFHWMYPNLVKCSKLQWSKAHSNSCVPHWYIGERKWQPDPVFLPGEAHGRRSLVAYSPWGRKELDMAEQPTHTWIYSSPELMGILVWVLSEAEPGTRTGV